MDELKPAGDASLARLTKMAQALSDPVRLRILKLLAERPSGCCPELRPYLCCAEGGLCVCELQALLDLGQSKVSYHLGVLRDAGLVKESRFGKWTFYSPDKETARKLIGLIQSIIHLEES